MKIFMKIVKICPKSPRFTVHPSQCGLSEGTLLLRFVHSSWDKRNQKIKVDDYVSSAKTNILSLCGHNNKANKINTTLL